MAAKVRLLHPVIIERQETEESADIIQIAVQPSLDHVKSIVEEGKKLPNPPNLVPLTASISSEFLTPSAIYLKIAAK